MPSKKVHKLSDYSDEQKLESVPDFFQRAQTTFEEIDVTKFMIIGIDDSGSSMMFMKAVAPPEIVFTMETLKLSFIDEFIRD